MVVLLIFKSGHEVNCILKNDKKNQTTSIGNISYIFNVAHVAHFFFIFETTEKSSLSISSTKKTHMSLKKP